MKTNRRFVMLASLLVPLCAQSGTLEEGAARTFHYDSGTGLHGVASHYEFNTRHGDLHRYNGIPVSRILVSRDLGPGALHSGALVSEDESHYYGGVTVGRATLAYFQGGGESFSRAPNPLYDDLNQYFFHGGSRADFSLSGAGASLGLGGGFSVQAAVTDVSAPGAVDRRGYYAGASRGGFEGGVFQVDRDGEHAGSGLNLAYQGQRFGIQYQEVRSDYDAHVRRLALDWSGSGRGSFSLELEQLRNDLYDRNDDNRVMLRFRRALGPTPAFSATDEGGNGEPAREGFGRAVAVGVGVGVAAVALASGGGNDGARRFAVRNEAAFSVLNGINPTSVRQNREHGGWIFRNADNTFGYTDPVAGTVNSVNIGNPVTAVPRGTLASASYHTHGGPDPRYDNENFSPQDILSDNLARTDGYLGTPAGFMKLHDFRSGSITVVGRINN